MKSNKELLKIAKSQIGNGGSKYRKYVGASGSWCDMFVFWLFDANGNGSLIPWKGLQRTYCPSSIKWCNKNLALIPSYLAMPCDIIYFDWENNGVPNHIGIVEKRISTATIATIEGNTSGGKVDDKTRNTKYAQGVYRPHFAATYKTAKLTVDGAFGYNSIAMLQKALGIKVDGILGIGTVKALQTKAGLKGKSADGAWGKATSKAVQKMVGVKADGEFGVASVKALQTWINKTAFGAGASNSVTTPMQNSTPSNGVIGKCIDASYWQGNISEANWKKIAKSVKYAICRASYTEQKSFKLNKDSTFANNFIRAKAAGLKVGAYHYSQAITVAEAKAEAEYLCNILKNYTPTFYVVCDFEFGGRLNSKIGAKASDIANAFCDVVKAHGYAPCIYANTSTLTKYLTKPKYPVWVAQYNDTCTYKGEKVMWQYTSKGRVDGIEAKNTNSKSANVDLSYVYKEPTIPTPKPKPVEKKGYTGTFPTLNNNVKIVNGLAYRHCYPYGTAQKKYTYKDGKPKDAYTKGIDKAYPGHKSWTNKKQKVGACCDVFVGEVLGHVGISLPKDLKNQLVQMPKMTAKLKSNGHYLAKDFKLGDVVQRGRKDKSGHTWIVFEDIKGNRYIANAHYKKLGGCYAVMDAKPANIVKSKWAYYKCYTVQGAIRTWHQKGDYGYDVLYIQKFLKWYGYTITCDGDFGAKTEEAVKKFQKANGLTADGQVGKLTVAKMKEVKK